MKIKDIIQTKRFHGTDPAVAYTDFRFVYLSWVLRNNEYDVAFIHEAGHIWLQHNRRRVELVNEEGDSFNQQCWLIATDMEIAKHLYVDNDTYIIERPRSALKGAITRKHTLKYPDCEYAEDFYHELKKEAQTQESNCCQHNSDSDDGTPLEDVQDLIEQAKIEVSEIKKSIQMKNTQDDINSFKPPKPSLASEIDRHLGRSKVQRFSSYRRPPRRENDSSLLKKGMRSKPQTPHMALYVDRSGSFDSTKTSKATNLIQTILKKYRGRISNDVFYFNDTLMTVDPIQGGGGTNYQAVIDNVLREKAQLTVIITDDDYYKRPEDLPKMPEIIVYPVGTTSTILARELSIKEVS